MSSSVQQQNKCSHLLVQNKAKIDLIVSKFKKDPIVEMFVMQLGLQEFMGKSKGSLTPLSSDVKLKSQEACYYFSAMNTEWSETMEKLCELGVYVSSHQFEDFVNPDFDPKEELLELKYEVIDMFHFLMNVCLYLGFDPLYSETEFQEFTLEETWGSWMISDSIDSLDSLDVYIQNPCFKISTRGFEETEKEILSLYARLTNFIGVVLDKSPYKKWKNYSEEQLNNFKVNKDMIVDDVLPTFFAIAKLVGIKREEFVDLYVSKNLENYNRQNNNY